jgi:hypothetical protein
LIDYLKSEPGAPEPLTLVIVRARRAEMKPSGGALRLTVSGKDLGSVDLTALNASSWSPVSEVSPGDGWTHLIGSGGGFYAAETAWK